MAQILSAAMLLRHGLNEEKAAKRIEEAVLGVLDAGYRTGDIVSPGTVSFIKCGINSFILYLTNPKIFQELVGCVRMGELVVKQLQSSVVAA